MAPLLHFSSFATDMRVEKPSLHEVSDSEDAKVCDKVPIRTLRFKVRPAANAWLNAAAIEANQVWNYFNGTSYKAARPFAGKPTWLSGFNFVQPLGRCKSVLRAYRCRYDPADCRRVCHKRSQFKKARLRWRVSSGSRRSLGWIPFKAASIRRHHRYLRFCGKGVRVFEPERFARIATWQSGCFSQDAVGDWYLCLSVKMRARHQKRVALRRHERRLR